MNLEGKRVLITEAPAVAALMGRSWRWPRNSQGEWQTNCQFKAAELSKGTTSFHGA
jgi:hypothetical protein